MVAHAPGQQPMEYTHKNTAKGLQLVQRPYQSRFLLTATAVHGQIREEEVQFFQNSKFHFLSGNGTKTCDFNEDQMGKLQSISMHFLPSHPLLLFLLGSLWEERQK